MDLLRQVVFGMVAASSDPCDPQSSPAIPVELCHGPGDCPILDYLTRRMLERRCPTSTAGAPGTFSGGLMGRKSEFIAQHGISLLAVIQFVGCLGLMFCTVRR